MALNDTVVVYDYPENVARAADVIKSLDVRPKQVLVEATILSATLTEGMELGIDLSLQGGVKLVGTSTTVQAQDTVVGGTVTTTNNQKNVLEQITAGAEKGIPMETSGFATVGGNGLRIGVKSGDTAAFITALESITNVTILANPKILAVNKQEGFVQIGKKLGYRGSSSVGQGGIVTQGTVSFLDTGTVLTFRPYIGNDGYIRMDIYPKDSTAQLNVDKVPDETVTQVKTNVLVKDGETIVIGGLFRDVVTTTRNQIPLLGDLPFIGALFRSTSDKSERQEVIVLLTPHIIDSANQTDGLARAEDISRKRFGAKEALQWTGRARLAEDRYTKAVEYYVGGDNEKAMREVDASLALRPTYFEALRLKERIIEETDPNEAAKMERIILSDMDKKEAENWLRR
jgi:type IV pilus assembly protein PilQ